MVSKGRCTALDYLIEDYNMHRTSGELQQRRPTDSNQPAIEVREVEGEPVAPTISPAQASAARKAAEALPQPPTTSEDTWGSGFNKESDEIEGIKVEAEREATPDGKVVVIKDDDITEEVQEL